MSGSKFPITWPATPSPALQDYRRAFSPEMSAKEFLTFYTIEADKSLTARSYSRGEFWLLALRAARIITEAGLALASFQTHFFSGNTLGDVVFRLASVMMGTTPVTINWQADTSDRVLHKIAVTKSKLVLIDNETPTDILERLKKEVRAFHLHRVRRPATLCPSHQVPGVTVFNVAQLEQQEPLPVSKICSEQSLCASSTRIVIFTSGTTGLPKGVQLSYGAYRCNRAASNSFLQEQPATIA